MSHLIELSEREAFACLQYAFFAIYFDVEVNVRGVFDLGVGDLHALRCFGVVVNFADGRVVIVTLAVALGLCKDVEVLPSPVSLKVYGVNAKTEEFELAVVRKSLEDLGLLEQVIMPCH